MESMKPKTRSNNELGKPLRATGRSPWRRAAAALALAGAGLAGSGAAHADFDRRALIELGQSVLRVEAQGSKGPMQLGSGVVIARERVVTNCHVTRNAESITLVQAGSRWTVQAQSVDAEHDLCLLQVPGLPHAPVAVGRAASLREGHELAALGYTGGPALRISGGVVVALHHWDNQLVIQCSNGFTSGASGGGLFDREGRLVGILTFRSAGAGANYYAVPAEWLPARPEAPPRVAEVRPHEGQGFWQRPLGALPAFLQAATLERAGQWDALLQLAERWEQQDRADAEPLYLAALAHERLGRDAAAAQAWRRSLDLNPGYGRSWAALARLYHRGGQEAQARQAIEALAALNPALAQDVAERLRSEEPPAAAAVEEPARLARRQ
ncbi:tetratricopeptide repeat-containing S1 family peptidase [Azohydromonas aeria]|uniref:tetratricopeptide repeat-containing S1 family peptidase n=1 Tax=Azohydromonas aeria TaxID=2590212 RepID=UPI0012F9538C|nr:tetratricopeptide repeat-containing serine protease family protein [Azohydromonas aeria]